MSDRLVVVTGGAGFIGSNIAKRLCDAGRRVVISDWLGDDVKWRNIAALDLHDVIRPDAFMPWLGERRDAIDAVVHMGAISATTETDVDKLVRENIRLSLDLWDFCASARVPYVFASSAATYGDGTQGFDDDGSIEALSRLRPLNAYGWSKHFVDRRIARSLAAGEAAPPFWAALKFFNVYGPNEIHKGSMRSVAQQMFEAIDKGDPIRLFRSHHPDYADGGQLRDFVYVEDCVDVIMWMLERRPASGLYNLGTGQARSFLDLARAVFSAVGQEPTVEYIDTPASIRAKYQYFTQAEIKRLRAVGYDTPFRSLEDGVAAFRATSF